DIELLADPHDNARRGNLDPRRRRRGGGRGGHEIRLDHYPQAPPPVRESPRRDPSPACEGRHALPPPPPLSKRSTRVFLPPLPPSTNAAPLSGHRCLPSRA